MVSTCIYKYIVSLKFHHLYVHYNTYVWEKIHGEVNFYHLVISLQDHARHPLCMYNTILRS